MKKSILYLISVFIVLAGIPTTARSSQCRDSFVSKVSLNKSLQSSKRKVGLELEFSNADYQQVLEAVARVSKGKIVGEGYLKFDQRFRPDIEMEKFARGENHGFKFSMRTIDQKVVSGRYQPSFNQIYIENHILPAKSTEAALAKVHAIFAGRTPFIDSLSTIEGSVIGRIELVRDSRYFELITEPLDLTQLKYFIEIYKMLIKMGVKGVESGHVVGLHINVSVEYSETELLKNLALTWHQNLKALRTLFGPSAIRSHSYGQLDEEVIAQLKTMLEPNLQTMEMMFDQVYDKGLDLNIKTVLNKKRPAVEVRLADADFTKGAAQKVEGLIRSTVDFVDKVDRLEFFVIQ